METTIWNIVMLGIYYGLVCVLEDRLNDGENNIADDVINQFSHHRQHSHYILAASSILLTQLENLKSGSMALSMFDGVRHLGVGWHFFLWIYSMDVKNMRFM